MLYTAAKEGTGARDVLEAVVKRIRPPHGRADAPLRALIFDSKYDSYKGVIAYVRVVDGSLREGERLWLAAVQRSLEPLEVGVFGPEMTPTKGLDTGEVGYVATG